MCAEKMLALQETEMREQKLKRVLTEHLTSRSKRRTEQTKKQITSYNKVLTLEMGIYLYPQ